MLQNPELKIEKEFRDLLSHDSDCTPIEVPFLYRKNKRGEDASTRMKTEASRNYAYFEHNQPIPGTEKIPSFSRWDSGAYRPHRTSRPALGACHWQRGAPRRACAHPLPAIGAKWLC